MALARYQRAIQDGSGSLNLLGTALQCEVRRAGVAGTPKAVLYSDREGTVTLGNPFAVAGGVVAFHAVGGAYNVRVYGAGYDETFTYEAIGTGAEVDADTLLIPGYLYEFETGTTAPPGDGGIRANNADLSLANRLWIHKETIAAIDVSPRIEGLETKRILVTSTNAGEQVGYDVDLVTDEGDHYELVLSEHVGATALAAGRCAWIRDPGEGPAGLDGVLSADEVELTTTSETLITAYKGKTIILNSATSMALAAQPAATLGADWMVIVKNVGAGTATLDPDGAETVDGAATLAIPQNMSLVLWSNGTALKTGMVSHAVQPLSKGGTGVALTAPATDALLGYDLRQGQARFMGVSELLPKGVLWGLGTANNASDATNDIDIQPGAVIDSTGTYVITIPSAVTRRLDGTSFTTGAGGVMRDTGAISDGTWHLFAILNPTTGDTQVLASKSLSAPTLPSGYTVFGRFWSIVRATSIRPYVQHGDHCFWSAPVQNLSTASPSTAGTSVALSVPTGILVLAAVTIGLNDNGAADKFILLSSLAQANTTPSSAAFTLFGGGDTSESMATASAHVLTNTSGEIRYRSSTASTVAFYLITHGYIDTRGR